MLQFMGSQRAGRDLVTFTSLHYDYTVDVTNTFKGLDMIESLKNYGQRFITLYRRW